MAHVSPRNTRQVSQMLLLSQFEFFFPKINDKIKFVRIGVHMKLLVPYTAVADCIGMSFLVLFREVPLSRCLSSNFLIIVETSCWSLDD